MYISITQAKVQLEKLITRALRGEEVIIRRWGTPVARLEPIEPPKIGRKLSKRPRRLPTRKELRKLLLEE